MSSAASVEATERGSWTPPTMRIIRAAAASDRSADSALPLPPDAPAGAAPLSKLGFAFEMSFPMSSRTTE